MYLFHGAKLTSLHLQTSECFMIAESLTLPSEGVIPTRVLSHLETGDNNVQKPASGLAVRENTHILRNNYFHIVKYRGD
jgi:hypothetical protein